MDNKNQRHEELQLSGYRQDVTYSHTDTGFIVETNIIKKFEQRRFSYWASIKLNLMQKWSRKRGLKEGNTFTEYQRITLYGWHEKDEYTLCGIWVSIPTIPLWYNGHCLNVGRRADWTFLINLATPGGFLFSYFVGFTIGSVSQWWYWVHLPVK